MIIRRFTKQSTRTCGNLTYLLEKFLKRQDDRNMDSLLFCWYQQWRRPKCQWFAWCNGSRISLVEFSFMIDLNWVGHYFHYVLCTYCIYSKYIYIYITQYMYIYTCILCYHKNTFTFLSQCRCCPQGFLGSLRWCTGFRTARTSWSFQTLPSYSRIFRKWESWCYQKMIPQIFLFCR